MAASTKVRKIKKGLRDADDILHLVTGKRMKNIVGTGVNLFGEELVKKVSGWLHVPEEPDLPLSSPYVVLGLRPDALDVVVRGAFRNLAREYHPDTGTKPDIAKFQAAKEAYDAILEERRVSKEAKESAVS